MTSARPTLRFGIKNEENCCASTWKVWSEKGTKGPEVYLANRSIGGALKASMHGSGNWHIAYSPRFFEQNVLDATQTTQDRFIDKWSPRQFAPGIILAFRIVTPWASTSIPIDPSQTKNVKWVPNAQEGRATEMYIAFTEQSVLISGWPGCRAMGTSLVGSISLHNGSTVWVVYREVDMPDFSRFSKKVEPQFFKNRSRNDLRGERLRALLMQEEPDGSRTFFDCIMQVEQNNTSIETNEKDREN